MARAAELPAEPSDTVSPADASASGERIGEAPEPTAPERTIDLGIGKDAWQRWVARPGDPVAALPEDGVRERARRPLIRMPERSTTGGLQEGLEARDRSLGLGPSGRVVTALYGAAHHPEAPRTGTARFQVTVSKSGLIEVSLQSASEPADGWRSLALRAAQELRRNPPRIPRASAGARIVVDLVAEDALPNGLKSKSLRGPRLRALPPRLRSTADAKKILEDRNPTIGKDGVLASGQLANSELPGAFVSGQGKICSYDAGATPLGTLQAPEGSRERSAGLDLRVQGNCDPSNIGAKLQRVVRATVRDEVMF